MAHGSRKTSTGRGQEDLAEHYEQLLVEQEESGLSVAEFAEQVGVSAGTLYSWRRRLGAPSQLVEVAVAEVEEEARGAGRLVLRVRNDYEVELDEEFDPEALRRLLGVLDGC